MVSWFTRHFEKLGEGNGSVLAGGVLFVFLLIVMAGATVKDQTDDVSPEPSTSTQIETEGQQSTECLKTETAVTMVRSIFGDSSATPSEVSLILEEAASMWGEDAANSTGSKRDWLLRMKEISMSVNGYVLTGDPEDGPIKLDQLFANMALTTNFCS